MRGHLKVDYEWAYSQVVNSADLSDIPTEWINDSVKSWMQGYVEGFLQGYTESRIDTLCSMIEEGLSPEHIADITGYSVETIKRMAR